jgi:hypothetical protein
VVYVDSMDAPFGRMLMCHMMADTTEELLAMVDTIGVRRQWIQNAGTYREHFDISRHKKRLALANGAQQVTGRQYAEILWRKRSAAAQPEGETK